jgi:hypothetical protein
MEADYDVTHQKGGFWMLVVKSCHALFPVVFTIV